MLDLLIERSNSEALELKMEENGIEIPSYFLCPISLQLMRDPVTISTGITYDRVNIEQWLFSYKKQTCPITKQSLSQTDTETDLTPNHTLRRLIQAWCILNASHGIERIPTPKLPIDKTQVVKILNEAKKFPNLKLKSLLRLKSIALESERNRTLVADADGVLEFLVAVIKNDDVNSAETAVEILFLLKPSNTHLKNLVIGDSQFIKSLTFILQRGNYQSRAYSIMLLKSIMEISEPIAMINIERELVKEIVRVIEDEISNQATKAALKVLIEINQWGRNRIKAVEGGAVSATIELLLNSTEKRRSELALMVLEQVCGCAEGREKLIEHGGGIAIVSKKILRVSEMGSDKAVRILSWISRFSGTKKVVKEMMEVGVVMKLCLVLQMDCCLKTRERARDILKLHSRVWNNSSCLPPHLLSAYPSS